MTGAEVTDDARLEEKGDEKMIKYQNFLNFTQRQKVDRGSWKQQRNLKVS